MLEPTARPVPSATPTGCGSTAMSSPPPQGAAGLLDEVLRLSRLGMWVWTVGSGHVQHNDYWYALLGITPGAVDDTVEGFMQLVYPPDRAAVSARIADLLQGRASEYHSEHRMVTPNGIVWVRDRGGIAERGPDGQPVRVLGCITDITESRRREAELAEQRRRFDDIVEATGIGTFEWDSRSNAVVLDERAAAAMGTNRQALGRLDGDAWRAMMHPDDVGRHDRALREHLEGRVPTYECELRLRQGQAAWTWLLLRGKLIDRGDGEGARVLSGTVQNITRLKTAEARSHESEELLRSAIDTIDEALVIFDADDRLAYCNQRYRDTYPLISDIIQVGVTFETIVRTWKQRGGGEPLRESIDDWVRERLRRHREGSLFVQQVEGGRFMRVLERRAPNGYTVGFRVDITDLVRAQQAAEAANVAKSQFLATMSHELRTPMNGILGAAQLLQQAGLPEAEREGYTNTILRSGQALLALLNDILDLSKVEAGRIDFEHIPLWPASLLEDTRSLFASLARDKGLGLEVCWHGPGDAAYRGDPGRLRQMLNNLVSNAIKFSSAGTVRLEARPLFESSGDGKTVLEFRVTDQGIGIAPEKQAQLFRPFSQVDASTTRRYGGTGLGLSIVKGLSELMGGDTGVHSRPGKGSAFWFTAALQPCAAGREGTEALPSAARSVEDAPLPADARLLVVEDHPANRYIIAHMLQRCGLTPEIAVHGQAAVDLIRLGRDFDLILMDVEMPVLDGYQATQAIRAVEADRAGGHRHAIIALTANAFPTDRQKALDAGMDDFIPKPIVLRQLRAKLTRWLSAVPPSGDSPSQPVD